MLYRKVVQHSVSSLFYNYFIEIYLKAVIRIMRSTDALPVVAYLFRVFFTFNLIR